MNIKNQKSYRIPCPVCKKITGVKIFEDTVILKFPLCCPICKQESIVNVVKLRITVEPRDDQFKSNK